MTQRQHKILGAKKGKKNKDEEIARKPIVFSCVDTDKMASASSKAKMNLTSKKENSREFSSYFYGKKKNTDPLYIATSHEEKKPLSKKSRVISTYPTLIQGLRWSPSVESYDEDYQEEEQNVICRNCQKQSYNTDWRDNMKTIRDNIRRFVDSSTMTPRLNDASCGACSPQSQASYTSSVSISSDIATRDVSNTQRKTPCVIPETDYIDDSEVQSYITPPSVRRTRLPLCRKTAIPSDQCDNPRKILYNEGISDIVANNFPNYGAYENRMQEPVRPKRNYNKPSVFSRGIPYAHRKHSKYHYDCNEQDFKSYRCDIEDEVKHLVAKPKVLRYCQAKKPNNGDVPIRMPKKVLSSERDIDSYIKRRHRKFF
ncbi:unnamed protein product [Colias eurytheme]|nr:unnamed protein product [Colias eurytheme]